MAKLVLVVDDDPDVWEILSLRLKSYGYDMISAKDGAQGIQKARELLPDLVLLDFVLPDGLGIEVLKKLKADSKDAVSKIPIIMLTGKEEHERDCLDSGAAGYITKPFDLFQLRETLTKFLSH